MKKIQHDPCIQLEIKLFGAKNISRGFWDNIDIPDPYVILEIEGVPWPKRRSKFSDNNGNPEWNEVFVYIIPRSMQNINLKITLMEANIIRAFDKMLGSTTFDCNSLKWGVGERKDFNVYQDSIIEVEFKKTLRHFPDMRLSLDLPANEINYLSARKRHALNAFKAFLNDANLTADQLPKIAVIASGGGYRATVGFAGAMKAIRDSVLFDCLTYIGTLSGSSWFVSSLYAHGGPRKTTMEEVTERIKEGMTSQLFSPLLESPSLTGIVSHIQNKREFPQPVSLVDLYGLLIGNKTLGESLMNRSKLSDFASVVEDGSVPMPVMTGIHVKAKTSEKDFAEWIEFSPFEVGIVKYGSFMKTRMFGSKFFKGCLIKQQEEYPLHFLMGIWASAFAICMEALLDDDEVEGDGDTPENAEPNLPSFGEPSSRSNSTQLDSKETNRSFKSESDSFLPEKYPSARKTYVCRLEEEDRKDLRSSLDSVLSARDNDSEDAVSAEKEGQSNELTVKSSLETSAVEVPSGFIKLALHFIAKTTSILSQKLRASMIHNFMRGMEMLPQTETPENSESTGGFSSTSETDAKRIYVVDAGLSFNLPFPPFLRPERDVDVIIAYDFSSRDADESPNIFRELLSAEQWAKENELSFPKIDVRVYGEQGMKEYYVFEDEDNPRAPVVIFLPLCNNKFKTFKAPGIPRDTEQEREFGNFSLFEDPEHPYRTFSRCYTELAFDRLHDLMKFNTEESMETIREIVRSRVKRNE